MKAYRNCYLTQSNWYFVMGQHVPQKRNVMYFGTVSHLHFHSWKRSIKNTYSVHKTAYGLLYAVAIAKYDVYINVAFNKKNPTNMYKKQICCTQLN